MKRTPTSNRRADTAAIEPQRSGEFSIGAFEENSTGIDSKPAITEDKLRRAREHIAKGLTVREAAMRVKVGKTALYEALAVEAA